jgi:hypothetical protein
VERKDCCKEVVIKAGGIDEKGEFIDGPEIAKYR